MRTESLNNIHNSDCLEFMKTLPENCIDSIITDPPYGLSFMGEKWDCDVPKVEVWGECLRVLKPGAYLLSFAGTRTQHRMACNIEDAGFEIRDMIAWVYGSGFPKSLNIGKAVDKLQGNERKEKEISFPDGSKPRKTAGHFAVGENIPRDTKYTLGSSEWEGWGTALKPALEPITVARKPLSEKTVAKNVLKWGAGGINIDGCRIDGIPPSVPQPNFDSPTGKIYGFKTGEGRNGEMSSASGRFPANLIHDGSDEVVELFPNTKSGSKPGQIGKNVAGFGDKRNEQRIIENAYGDSGSASRFFYCAKASKSERNRGLDSTLTVKYNGGICEENMVAVQLLQKVISEQELVSFNTGEFGENIMVQCQQDSLSIIKITINKIIESKILNSLMLSLTNESTLGANYETDNGGNLAESVESLKKWILTTTRGKMELARGASRVALETLFLTNEEENWKNLGNFHSTVKPIALMEYLVKLVSREGAVVLDPFAGSGSTGIACKKLRRNYVLVEKDVGYCKIAEKRIKAISSSLF